MFAGFGKYTRFIGRRERVVSSIWAIAISLCAVGIIAMYPGLFDSGEALNSAVAMLSAPPMVAMMGPVYGIGALTHSMAFAQECMLWFSIAVVIMNVFYINRHTRVDEELGRHEVLISLPVGRLTGSAAALFGAVVLNLIIAAATALLIIAAGVNGTTVAGAFVYSGSIAAQGFLFACITLLAAQIFSTARGASGLAFAVMGVSYILRALGDMRDNALAYISPLGLGLRVEAFYGNKITPIIALLLESAVIAVIALAINARRDVGAGLVQARKGRSSASKYTQNPLGFAWRLSRGSFIAWALVSVILGGMYGVVVGSIDDLANTNDSLRQIIEGGVTGVSLADAYIPMICAIMAIVTAIPIMATITRMRSEEKRGRLEQLLARSVSRARLFCGFVAIAAAQALVLTFLSGVGMFAAAGATAHILFATALGAVMVYVPAIWVMGGLAAMVTGLAPKLSGVCWAAVAYVFFMFYFGRLPMGIPEWAKRVSPFANVSQIPLEDFASAPMIILIVIAAVMCALGALGIIERDVNSN